MDYTNSECQSMFSAGQSQRMYSQFDEYRRRVEPCTNDETSLFIEMRYDNKPHEIDVGFIDWGARNRFKFSLKPQGENHVDFSNQVVSRDLCLPKHLVHEFYLEDGGGNGLQSPGYFKLVMNGREFNEANFGSSKMSVFVSGDSQECASGSSRFNLELKFDDSAWHLFWEIRDSNNYILADASDTFGYSANEYYDLYDRSLLMFDLCLPVGDYTFVIRDDNGDGISSPGYYALAMEGEEFKRGGGDGGFQTVDSIPFAVSDKTLLNTESEQQPGAPSDLKCDDSIGFVDRFGKGCSWYNSNGCDAALTNQNSAGVSARQACCSCDGGNQDFNSGSGCQDYFGFVDAFNGNCEWYWVNGCRGADQWPNNNGVSGNDACCSCGGGSQLVASPAPPIAQAFCFPASSNVIVQDKGVVSMGDLAIGDLVLVGNDHFEPVYSFGHYKPRDSGQFLRIQTANTTLTLSESHMVFLKGNMAVPASQLIVGGILLGATGEELKVSGIEVVMKEGLFAPFTPSGTIVVDGVLASSFVAFEESESLKVLGIDVSFQWIAHTFEFPHRVMCSYLATCPKETYDSNGVSEWVATPLQLAQRLLRHPSWWFRNMALTLFVTVLWLFYLVELLVLQPIIGIAGLYVHASI